MNNCWYDNKTVILTGASSGIGKDIAERLVKEHGCRVIGIARNEERLLNFKNSLGDKGDRFTYYTFDVSVRENWESFAEIVKELGIKVLICGAVSPYLKDIMEKTLHIQQEQLMDLLQIDINIHKVCRHGFANWFFWSYISICFLCMNV